MNATTLRTRPSIAIFLVALTSLVSTAPIALAENWPAWRGPNGDGVSHEQDLPLVWSESHGVHWKTDLPEWGTSTPAIWGDSIFVTTHDSDNLVLLKIEAPTGQVVWSRKVGASDLVAGKPVRGQQKFHQLHNQASPSPVTDGEVVVAHFGNGDLAAYDFEGQELWRHNLQKEYGAYTIWWGHANSPVLYGDLVISVCMQDSLVDLGHEAAPSYLVAHDKRTGVERWKSMRMTAADAEEGDSYTTPVLHRAGSRATLIVMGANQVDGYDPATGRQMWFLAPIVGGRTITGPTVAHDRVYVTQGMRGNLLAVPLDREGKLARQDVVWSETDSTSDSCCPVVWGDWLLTLTDNGVVCCYNALSGQRQWKSRLPGDYKASPVAAEGRIYFLNTSGLATVIAADDRFEKLAENQLEDETIASPAIAGGRIYIRSRKRLYAIGK